ncbi:nitroreductase family deazaflavin-dependent oxidoreductase [Nocardioides sp.]|uniref:nitroreductase family deazaflavin-dependent oxidoreductase n=1 Tax=Nocardioides sp. TaxID=35761 RepID=UPI00286E5654|nr:nitroreductase family deazaflavin-dependent oxidoreductase [Nocardioides sp.]
MTLQGRYAPSPTEWVRTQVEKYEATGGADGNEVMGRPIVVITSRGARSGLLRKNPVMRVEHEGVYAAVASKGGADDNPSWYANFLADPVVDLQDGPTTGTYRAREISGDERALWWERSAAAFPQYAKYAEGTDRLIPVFLLERIEA